MLVVNGEEAAALGIDGVQELGKPPEGLGAEHQVHMAVGGADLVRHRPLLGHAAAQADHLLRLCGLGVGQPAQKAVDPLFRVLPDGAGVDHNDVRGHGVLRKAAAHLLQHPHDALAVGHVLLAAKGVHHGQRPPVQRIGAPAELFGKFSLPLHLSGGYQYIFSVQNSISCPGAAPRHSCTSKGFTIQIIIP